MSMDVRAAGPDTLTVVLEDSDGDGRALTVLEHLQDWLWETFGFEIQQSVVLVTLVFPEAADEHGA